MTALFFLFLSPAFAAELAPEGTWQRKFQRGALNTVFAPLEVSHALEEVKAKDEWVPTWIPRAVGGAALMVVRGLTGIYEMVTAPLAIPSGYQPILEPELTLEYLDLLKKE